MTERRYSDDEVAEIFSRASEKEQTTRRHLPPSEGMTLAQLQDIGREAGLAPELVAHAARSLDQPGQPVSPTLLGLPLGAARTVHLERRLTNDEWERLVVDLRETFEAKGVVRVEGSLRSWSNGNLQALVEPDGDGQRVRLRTIKGTARPFMYAGIAMLGVSVASFAARFFPGGEIFGNALGGAEIVGLWGAGLLAYGAIPLKPWAKRRQQQMDAIADRLIASHSERSG